MTRSCFSPPTFGDSVPGVGLGDMIDGPAKGNHPRETARNGVIPPDSCKPCKWLQVMNRTGYAGEFFPPLKVKVHHFNEMGQKRAMYLQYNVIEKDIVTHALLVDASIIRLCDQYCHHAFCEKFLHLLSIFTIICALLNCILLIEDSIL
ncbi:hypothetical protein WA026_006498 [Henosepilachna vigintioctopunctata]|uniref:Uncharacterized protein n=1 Tax=Henosepilachna vigintioctopunctata TaxID=420089 RepID=A0AAW1UFF7_9CUCU